MAHYPSWYVLAVRRELNITYTLQPPVMPLDTLERLVRDNFPPLLIIRLAHAIKHNLSTGDRLDFLAQLYGECVARRIADSVTSSLTGDRISA